MAHQVKILTQYCKGCELCVAVCPKGVLEMSEELTEVGVRPARPKTDGQCTGCTLCPRSARMPPSRSGKLR